MLVWRWRLIYTAIPTTLLPPLFFWVPWAEGGLSCTVAWHSLPVHERWHGLPWRTRPDVLPGPVPEARETSDESHREAPRRLLSRRPSSGRPALSAVELLLEDAFQGHSFCLEQGLGLNDEPETGTNCTSLLNLEPNPNIFYIAENQTSSGVWFGLFSHQRTFSEQG